MKNYGFKIMLFYVMLFLFTLFFYTMVYAANSQSSADRYEYATVDTAPGASGYYTNDVVVKSKSNKSDQKIWFSVRGTGTMTVVLQFKCSGDTVYTDYAEYTTNQRKVIEGGAAGVKWRGIVKSGGHSSGSKTFGFDW